MTIREIAAADREAFLELMDEFYHSEAVLHPVPRAYMERSFAELMRSGEYLQAWFLETGDALAGYALISRSFSPEAGGTVIWLEELYLRPDYRGQGMGGEFLGWMKENVPAARYRLEVEPENHRVKALYRRYGFEIFPYQQMVLETPGE